MFDCLVGVFVVADVFVNCSISATERVLDNEILCLTAAGSVVAGLDPPVHTGIHIGIHIGSL